MKQFIELKNTLFKIPKKGKILMISYFYDNFSKTIFFFTHDPYRVNPNCWKCPDK